MGIVDSLLALVDSIPTAQTLHLLVGSGAARNIFAAIRACLIADADLRATIRERVFNPHTLLARKTVLPGIERQRNLHSPFHEAAVAGPFEDRQLSRPQRSDRNSF